MHCVHNVVKYIYIPYIPLENRRHLHKVEFGYLLVYSQSLTTVSGGGLFGSVTRALDMHWYNPGFDPQPMCENFQLGIILVSTFMLLDYIYWS